MFKITLITLGKINKNSPEYILLNEYIKLIKSKINLIELEVKNPPKDSKSLIEKEADLILAKIPSNSHKILLEIEGIQYSSQEFANNLSKYYATHSHICFIIGGAYGTSLKVKEICVTKLSLSKMTFTHIWARILLLEQIYRAELILNNHPYHK